MLCHLLRMGTRGGGCWSPPPGCCGELVLMLTTSPLLISESVSGLVVLYLYLSPFPSVFTILYVLDLIYFLHKLTAAVISVWFGTERYHYIIYLLSRLKY